VHSLPVVDVLFEQITAASHVFDHATEGDRSDQRVEVVGVRPPLPLALFGQRRFQRRRDRALMARRTSRKALSTVVA